VRSSAELLFVVSHHCIGDAREGAVDDDLAFGKEGARAAWAAGCTLHFRWLNQVSWGKGACSGPTALQNSSSL